MSDTIKENCPNCGTPCDVQLTGDERLVYTPEKPEAPDFDSAISILERQNEAMQNKVIVDAKDLERWLTRIEEAAQFQKETEEYKAMLNQDMAEAAKVIKQIITQVQDIRKGNMLSAASKLMRLMDKPESLDFDLKGFVAIIEKYAPSVMTDIRQLTESKQ
jgi:hypothetical protein